MVRAGGEYIKKKSSKKFKITLKNMFPVVLFSRTAPHILSVVSEAGYIRKHLRTKLLSACVCMSVFFASVFVSVLFFLSVCVYVCLFLRLSVRLSGGGRGGKETRKTLKKSNNVQKEEKIYRVK